MGVGSLQKKDVLMKFLSSFLTLLFIGPVLWAAPSTEEVIAKAREYLGGEAALDGLHSIHYEGTFETPEGDTGPIDIIFQKPMQQRLEVVRGEVGEVTALDDFEAWRKRFDVSNPSRGSLMFLDAQAVRELQANTWANLHFYRGIEERRGWIENEGLVDLNGRQAVKLVFHYPYEIIFTRFFDTKTGRLVLTRTSTGMEIQETGQIHVNGIVFPETLTMTMDGEIANRIHFTDITVNETFDDSLFAVPSLMP